MEVFVTIAVQGMDCLADAMAQSLRIDNIMTTTLYQLDSKNKKRIWQIEVHGSASAADLAITTGLLDGKHVTSLVPVYGKNEGKANETDCFEQALKELDARVKKQIKKGYVNSLEELKPSTELGSGIPAPMLAHKFDPKMLQKGSKNLEKLGLLGQHVIVQPKYDGNRCIIVVSGSGAKLYSRSGDLMPVQLPHIVNDISAAFLSDMTVNISLDRIILDGELYSEKLSFN